MVVAGAAAGAVGPRRHATVSTMPRLRSSGTATRSAHATARGPIQTTAVANTPSPTAQLDSEPPIACAHADAAMTLFSAIQAKFDPYKRTATTAAPRMPRTGRVAINEGTRKREPSG